MKNFVFIVFILLSCQIKKAEVNNSKSSLDDILINLPDTSGYESEKEFIDRLYNCECDKYISKLIEIPNRDSNAYRITIKSKNGNWKKSSLINSRPEMSRISYCNDLYTVVSFP